jgi:cysteine synthase
METINENTISFINIFNELCANGVIDSQADLLKKMGENAYQLGQANNPLNHSIHNTSDNAESHNPQ